MTRQVTSGAGEVISLWPTSQRGLDVLTSGNLGGVGCYYFTRYVFRLIRCQTRRCSVGEMGGVAVRYYLVRSRFEPRRGGVPLLPYKTTSVPVPSLLPVGTQHVSDKYASAGRGAGDGRGSTRGTRGLGNHPSPLSSPLNSPSVSSCVPRLNPYRCLSQGRGWGFLPITVGVPPAVPRECPNQHRHSLR